MVAVCGHAYDGGLRRNLARPRRRSQVRGQREQPGHRRDNDHLHGPITTLNTKVNRLVVENEDLKRRVKRVEGMVKGLVAAAPEQKSKLRLSMPTRELFGSELPPESPSSAELPVSFSSHCRNRKDIGGYTIKPDTPSQSPTTTSKGYSGIATTRSLAIKGDVYVVAGSAEVLGYCASRGFVRSRRPSMQVSRTRQFMLGIMVGVGKNPAKAFACDGSEGKVLIGYPIGKEIVESNEFDGRFRWLSIRSLDKHSQDLRNQDLRKGRYHDIVNSRTCGLWPNVPRYSMCHLQ
jgi:hypothetical protein